MKISHQDQKFSKQKQDKSLVPCMCSVLFKLILSKIYELLRRTLGLGSTHRVWRV